MHIVCMKRMNVVLDEELVDEVRRESGERTYSAALTKELEEFVRIARLTRAIQEMRDTKDFFRPGYLEKIRPNSWAAIEMRRAAEKKTKPRKKVARGRRAR